MVCTVYAYGVGKMTLVGHQLSKIQEGKLHYCSVEIDLCESEDNRISYDLSLFDDTADPKIVIEIVFGVRLFFRRHQSQIGERRYSIHIINAKTTYIDFYAGDGVLVAYLALFKWFFPDEDLPIFQYKTETGEWHIKLDSSNEFTTNVPFYKDLSW